MIVAISTASGSGPVSSERSSLVAVVARVKRASELLSRYPLEIASAVNDRAPSVKIADRKGAGPK